MNVNDFYASKFLAATDLGNASHVVQIAKIEREQLQDGKVKPAIYFVGQQKALLCNKTNALVLAARFGPDMNGWIGKSVELFSTIVQGPSGPVPGIRMRVVDQPQQAPVPAAPTADAAGPTQSVF